jgi:hypothetical protein
VSVPPLVHQQWSLLVMAKKAEKNAVLEIQNIEMRLATFYILGTSPMIMNRFSQKAWQELLFPAARRSRAELDQSLKHDPVAEFRGALYKNRDAKMPTLVHVPSGAFHGAIASAALDIPGAAKAKIERLTGIVDANINLYGVPYLFMAMVRNSDMNRTPDVRTRPVFPEWACKIQVSYVRTVLTERTIANLLGAAGSIVGIGDWRRQKGGSYGAFEIVEEGNADWKRITRDQGRKAQQAAFDSPACHDLDSEELFSWFQAELLRRERDVPSAPAKAPKGKRVVVENGRGELQT